MKTNIEGIDLFREYNNKKERKNRRIDIYHNQLEKYKKDMIAQVKNEMLRDGDI